MIFKYFACRVIIILLLYAFLLKFSRLIWNAFQIETAYYLWNFGFVQIQKFSTFAISFSTDNTQKFFFLIYSTSEKVSHWKIDFVPKFLLFKVLSYLVKNYDQKKTIWLSILIPTVYPYWSDLHDVPISMRLHEIPTIKYTCCFFIPGVIENYFNI